MWISMEFYLDMKTEYSQWKYWSHAQWLLLGLFQLRIASSSLYWNIFPLTGSTICLLLQLEADNVYLIYWHHCPLTFYYVGWFVYGVFGKSGLLKVRDVKPKNFVYSLTPSKHSLLYHICYICYICFIGGQLVNYCKRMMIDPAEILSSGKKFWIRQKIVTLGCARTWFWTKADFPLKDWKVQRREICSVIIEFLPQAIDQDGR